MKQMISSINRPCIISHKNRKEFSFPKIRGRNLSACCASLGLAMYRVGFGYDVHKIEKSVKAGNTCVNLCGVSVPCEYVVIAHSDGDVALHALVDALLGAACIEGADDIGMLFPNTDEKWRGKSSSYFVGHVLTLIQRAGYMVNNADLTIVCETPRIQRYKSEMRQQVANLLCVRREQVNVKATTTEKLGFEGRKEGIAVYAVASLIKMEQ